MPKNNLIVLGIQVGTHESGASIVKNGKVLAAINEDRIRNIKHYEDYPTKSVEEVVRISKIEPSEIDAIAITNVTEPRFKKKFSPYPEYYNIIAHWSWVTSNPDGLKQLSFYHHNFNKILDMKKTLSKIGIPLKQVIIVEHHLAHAATAYYLSPWSLDDDVLVLTADGQGDGLSSTVSIGKKGKIDRLKDSETNARDSLGEVYSVVTGFLGMHYGFHASKVMGLAPYGNLTECINQFKKMHGINNANPLTFKNKLGGIHLFEQSFRIEKLLHNQRFDNIAAAMQELYETLMLTWVKNAIKKTGIHKLAVAGGNFQNIKTNQKILSLEDVDDAFFCPAASDEGLSVGAALHGYFTLAFKDGIIPSKVPLKKPYFGSSFSNDEIKQSLEKNNLLIKSTFVDDIDEEVGELISKQDNVVARFNGRTEWGPRALGNRSILADPSDQNMIRKINQAIKKRDFWMPFAPSILSNRLDDYLENSRDSPYMTLTFDTTEKRDELSAAIHPYDFSCRAQTVNSEYNPGYEKVLKSFEKKTGIGAVLNTSFNIHGYPIGYDPELAIKTFTNSDLKYLAIGNYLIKK